jgi:hypothetical protein
MPATFRKSALRDKVEAFYSLRGDYGRSSRDEEAMGKLIIDESLRTKLSQAQEEIELLDQQGAQVGFFFPSQLYLKLMYAWARAEFADDQDVQRARAEPGGMTTAEVLRHLRQVEQEKSGK